MKILTYSLLNLTLIYFASCKKISDPIADLKDKIINAYWADFNNLTIQIEDGEGYVVDFGTSNLGSNPSVFSPEKPFLKNISRTDRDSWTADVVKPTFDNQGKLNGITYEPVSINMSTSSAGKDIITIVHSSEIISTLTMQPNTYTPPADPYHQQPVVCSNMVVKTKEGNSLSLRNYWRGNIDSTNIRVESQLYMPMNHSSITKCHYKMNGFISLNGNLIELIVYFSHKPTQNQIFTVKDYGFGSIVTLNHNQAIISLEYGQFLSINNGSIVNITVDQGKVIATLVNIELKPNSMTLQNCRVSGTLKG
jgi:hypothetical protein